MSKFVAERSYRMTDADGNLVISFVIKDKRLGMMAFNECKDADKLQVEMKPYKSQRSLAQNRLLWELLGKMAEAYSGRKTTVTSEECYCMMLESVGIECEYILALPETEKLLRQYFRALRKVDEREVNGKVLNMYQCFVGSSKFDTKQMTDFIESVLDKLAELGVCDSETESARRQVYEKFI